MAQCPLIYMGFYSSFCQKKQADPCSTSSFVAFSCFALDRRQVPPLHSTVLRKNFDPNDKVGKKEILWNVVAPVRNKYLQENGKGCDLIKKQHENRRGQKEEVQEQRERNKR